MFFLELFPVIILGIILVFIVIIVNFIFEGVGAVVNSVSNNYKKSSYSSSTHKEPTYDLEHNYSSDVEDRKYYAYGTYAENGKLYNMEGEEIKNSKKYYDECRKNKEKSSGKTYSSKGFVYEYKENHQKYNYYKKK